VRARLGEKQLPSSLEASKEAEHGVELVVKASKDARLKIRVSFFFDRERAACSHLFSLLARSRNQLLLPLACCGKACERGRERERPCRDGGGVFRSEGERKRASSLEKEKRDGERAGEEEASEKV
jgi:hypothetical protein